MALRVQTPLLPHFGRTTAMTRALQAVLATGALLVCAGGAVALLAPGLADAPVASTGQTSALAMLLVLFAGLTLVAAGSVAWFGRGDRGLAVVAFAAAAAWMSVELAGSASVTREARTAGALLAPLLGPLVLHLPLSTLHADHARGGLWWAILTVYLAALLLSLGRALTYDPFFDADCAPVCARGDNMLALARDVPLAKLLERLGLIVTVVSGLVLSAWSVTRLVRRRRGGWRAEWFVLLPSAALGLALASWAAARTTVTPYQPADPVLLTGALATAACLCLLGVGVTALLGEEMRRTQALRRLADDLAAAAGSPSLRATLAHTLGDRSLRVAYPLDGGGFIDDQGEPVAEPGAGEARALTAIKRGDQLVAVVEHDASLDADLLDREIGAAARLAVDNERLEATIRARLRELRASRTRIVATADAARGRLERDLHDGAQQRLLTVSFELRLLAAALAAAGADAAASTATETRTAIDRAMAETDAALSELRDLAHGIHPVVLTEDGLDGALASLAETADVALVVTGDPIGRCAAPAELAAYLGVVEAVRQAEVEGVEEVLVRAERCDGTMRLTIVGTSIEERRRVRIEDRVGAAGGHLDIAQLESGRSMLAMELPCA